MRSPSCTAVVHEISQRDKDAFIFGEGCAGLARRQTGRDHSLPPGPGRAAPPICSDLIYDRHTYWLCIVGSLLAVYCWFNTPAIPAAAAFTEYDISMVGHGDGILKFDKATTRMFERCF